MDRSQYLQNQIKAIVQSEAAVSELLSSGYQPVRAVLEEHTTFRAASWATSMTAAALAARAAHTAQNAADANWLLANADVQATVAKANEWRQELNTALLAAAEEVDGAPELAKRLLALHPEVAQKPDTYEEHREQHPVLLMNLEAALEIPGIDLPGDFFARGQAIATSLVVERSEADATKGARATQTEALRRALTEIGRLATLYDLRRSLAEQRTGRALPGFDLTYVRSTGEAAKRGQVVLPTATDPALPPPVEALPEATIRGL